MKKLNIIGEITANSLFIITLIYEAVRVGQSEAFIPNSGFLISFGIFFALSVARVVVILLVKDDNIAIGISIARFLLFQFAVYALLGWWALNYSYMEANRIGTIHDNIFFSIAVMIFIAIGVLSLVYDLIVRFSKIFKPRLTR